MPGPYTADPMQWDHRLTIGATYTPRVIALVDLPTGGTAVDITGVTGTVEIRTEDLATLLLTCDVTILSAVGGTFYWSALPADTADLEPNPTARYAVQLTFPGGEVRPVLEGVVDIVAGVVAP